MPKTVHSLISIASLPALGTPGCLNKARLWQWDGESTPEEIRQTTHCMLWLSWRGRVLLAYLSNAIYFSGFEEYI